MKNLVNTQLLTRETLETKQIKEALYRMYSLRLMKQVIQDFINEKKIYYSERLDSRFNAILYWVSNDKNLEKKINEFENRTGSLVYHVQLLHTTIGDMYSFLYVSNNPDDWENDREDLRNQQCFVYVWNGDIEEYGTIGIKSSLGGVVRTW